MNKFFTLLIGASFCAGVATQAQTSIFKEDFESVTVPALPNGWSQDIKDTAGWKTETNAISFSSGYGIPSHTKFALLDDWNKNLDNSASILITPYLDLAGKTHTFLKFSYFFNGVAYTGGTPKESAYVVASMDSGKTWTVLETLKATTAWEEIHINLNTYDNMSDVLIGFKYNDGGDPTKALFGIGVDDIEVFIPRAKDVKLTSVSPETMSLKSYAVKGTSKLLSGTVFNNGWNDITSFTVHYQEGSSPVVSDIISGVTITPFTSYDFADPTALTMPASLGEYPVKMWIELTGDSDPSNDSGNTVIVATDFTPKKKILVEEATGTWCGWCPRGAVYMDSVWHTYPDEFSLVAVHNQDPMTNAAYDAFMGGFLSAAKKGYPSVIIDRRDVLDPSELLDVRETQRDNFGFADITLESPDAPGFDVIIKATVKPAIDIRDEFRLAVAITEDDVHGTTSTWAQSNYYSGYAPLTGAGIDWYSSPAKVPGDKMHYEFVGRMMSPAPGGAPGSLPLTMGASTTHDYTFQFTVPQPYNRANLRAVVMLIRNYDGQVMNSNYTKLTTGISNIDAGINKLSVYPNPAYDNTFVNFNLKENSTVVVKVTDAVGRIVNTIPSQELSSGSHKLSINTANLSAGIYNVTVITGKGSISERLSVVK